MGGGRARVRQADHTGNINLALIATMTGQHHVSVRAEALTVSMVIRVLEALTAVRSPPWRRSASLGSPGSSSGMSATLLSAQPGASSAGSEGGMRASMSAMHEPEAVGRRRRRARTAGRS